MDIALVGAGIGGLAAAACLLQQGHKVRIYEQAGEVSEVGAAVQMSANAVKVLYQLGLKETLEQHAVKPESFQFLRHDTGELLHLIVLGEEHEKRHGHPYYQIHRVDLHQGLLHAVLALDPGALVLGKRAASVSETGQGAGIRFEDGTEVHAELVIGSDGIKSVVRRHVVDDTPPVFTGQVAWRLAIPIERIAPELRPLMGAHVYGCDDCQLACPWNKYAKPAGLADFRARPQWTEPSLADWLRWDEDTFLRQSEGSPIRRIGHTRWLRNVAIASGNALRPPCPLSPEAQADLLAALEALQTHAHPLVREHVAWALAQV